MTFCINLFGSLLLQIVQIGSQPVKGVPSVEKKLSYPKENFRPFLGGYLHHVFNEVWSLNSTGVRTYINGLTIKSSIIYHPRGEFTSRRWLSLEKASIVIRSKVQPVDAWLDDGGRYGHGACQLVVRNEESKRFAKTIAETPASDRILIRFIGRDAGGRPKSEDVILLQEQRQAIRETWRLYLWLSKDHTAGR